MAPRFEEEIPLHFSILLPYFMMMRRLLLLSLLASADVSVSAGSPVCPDEKAPLFPTSAMPAEVQEARKNCVGRLIPDFVTPEGREFRKVKIRRAGDYGLDIAHHTGICVVPYHHIPGDLQKELLGFSFPPMSPAVKRRQAILRLETATLHLEERVNYLKGTYLGGSFSLARERERHDASLAENRNRISAEIESFQAQKKQVEKELADFDSPEAVAARRKEMEKIHSKQKESGRPVAEPNAEIFDKRHRLRLEGSIRIAISRLTEATESLKTLEANAKREEQRFARQAKENAAQAKMGAPIIARAEKKLEASRTVLAKLLKESAEQKDDPAAFDRYCEEHKYPRGEIGSPLSR